LRYDTHSIVSLYLIPLMLYSLVIMVSFEDYSCDTAYRVVSAYLYAFLYYMLFIVALFVSYHSESLRSRTLNHVYYLYI